MEHKPYYIIEIFYILNTVRKILSDLNCALLTDRRNLK